MTGHGSQPDAVAAALASFRSSRSEKAFRVLYRLTTPRLWSMALRIAGDPGRAEDAVQEAWLRAVRGLGGFAGRSRFETWITGILVRCIHEGQRQGWRHEGTEPSAESVTPAGDRGARVDVARALAALAPGFRSVIVLHDLHGYTHEEIGGMLGIEAGTSKSQLSRGRRALRQALRPNHASTATGGER